MIKLRLTFTDNEKGKQELSDFLEMIQENKMFECINESKIYNSRGKSLYSNIYLDIEYK